MKYNISKELFEAVIGEEFNSVNDNYIYMGIKNTKDSARISINDFFFLCKEWLEETTSYDIVINEDNVMLIYDLYAEGGICIHEFFGAKDVKQSLFDACQYVLDNKDKQ